MIKVSVIVPVFNAEKYIKKCIVSLCTQTLNDMEIIAVDDGSSDASAELLSQLSKKYSNLTVITQKNAGLPAARNTGLAAAKGEFVGFCDADDYVDADMYERLYRSAKNADARISCCGFEIFCAVLKKRFPLPEDLHEFGADEIRNRFLSPVLNDTLPFFGAYNVTNKVFNREMLVNNHIIFPEDWSHAEDHNFIFRCLIVSEKIVFEHFEPYHYRRSLTKKTLSGRFRPDFFQCEMLYRDFVNKTVRPYVGTPVDVDSEALIVIGKSEKNAFNIINSALPDIETEQYLHTIFEDKHLSDAFSACAQEKLSDARLECKSAVADGDFVRWKNTLEKLREHNNRTLFFRAVNFFRS